jgi:DNA topoisomerase VI subunit B
VSKQATEVRLVAASHQHMQQLQRITFETSRLLDFFSEKELVAQTGHQVADWPLVIVKELIDNALDACEEAGTPPEIIVAVDEAGIEVQDNGPGMPPETVKGALGYAVRVSSREAYISPTRGAQGNALKTIIGMPFALNPDIGAVLDIDAKGTRHVIRCAVDRIRQEPKIEHHTEDVKDGDGTDVRVRWPADSPRSNLVDAKARFLQIVEDFAWLNPHLSLELEWFGERVLTVRATNPAWRKWKPSDPTSAHWYRPSDLERLIAAYIAHDQGNGRVRTVRELITEFRGLSGSVKQKAVLNATGLSREPLTAFIADSGDLDSAKVRGLLRAMQAHSRPVKPQDLGIIGEEHFKQRFTAAGCEMESFAYQKIMENDGQPAVMELAFGWCPEGDGRLLVTGVNWSAAIINPFRQLGGPNGRSLDTILTSQRVAEGEPVIMVAHLAQPRVQYTDRGKSAVVTE